MIGEILVKELRGQYVGWDMYQDVKIFRKDGMSQGEGEGSSEEVFSERGREVRWLVDKSSEGEKRMIVLVGIYVFIGLVLYLFCVLEIFIWNILRGFFDFWFLVQLLQSFLGDWRQGYLIICFLGCIRLIFG